MGDFSVRETVSLLHRHRIFHYLAVGGSGAALNLLVSWFMTTFVVGLEGYFVATLTGLAVNIMYNFTMYSLAVFREARMSMQRFVVFVLYSLATACAYALIVRFVTELLGAEYYLVVSFFALAFFAVLNFFVLRLSIFRAN